MTDKALLKTHIYLDRGGEIILANIVTETAIGKVLRADVMN